MRWHDPMRQLSERLISELVDAVRAQLRREQSVKPHMTP